jgi:CBS-domain-containing membrane protein
VIADTHSAVHRSERAVEMTQTIGIWLYRAIGAGTAIAIMELLARVAHQPLARVPFVTSIVLTMALPDSEGARPYAVIAGHLLSCLAGFAALWVIGPGEAASAVAVGLAALLMLASRAMHPPAGIDAFLVAGLGLPLGWALSPVLIGVLLLAVFSRLWAAGEHRLPRRLGARR